MKKASYLTIGLLLIASGQAQTDIKPRTVNVSPPPATEQRTPPPGAVPSEPAPQPPPGTEILVGEAAERAGRPAANSAPVSAGTSKAAVAVPVTPSVTTPIVQPPVANQANSPIVEPSHDQRADARYNEMRRKITAAVEEVLQLYGNPPFAQLVTNDAEKAAELRQRLAASTSSDQIKAEIAALEKKREALRDDVALAERTLAQARAQAARLRATIDQTVMALQSAQRTMEGEIQKPLTQAP